MIPQQAQILQTPDGQTFIYQPSAVMENAIQQPAQPTRKFFVRSSGYFLVYIVSTFC